MHFDQWIEKKLGKTSFDVISEKETSSINIITRHKEHNNSLSIMFMPWQSGELIQNWIIKQVPKSRNIIDLSPKFLLLPDAIETSKLTLKVCDEALEAVQKELRENTFKNINIIGLSVGTGLAAYVANRIYKEFNLDHVDFWSLSDDV